MDQLRQVVGTLRTSRLFTWDQLQAMCKKYSPASLVERFSDIQTDSPEELYVDLLLSLAAIGSVRLKEIIEHEMPTGAMLFSSWSDECRQCIEAVQMLLVLVREWELYAVEQNSKGDE